MENQNVGFVLGTKESSPFNFFVAILKDNYLQLDDLVLLKEKVNDKEIEFYGIVSNVHKSFEGLNFNSENLMAIEGKIPTEISHVAEISVLRVEPEIFVAPTPGNPIEKVLNPQKVAVGYYFDKMDTKIPVGFFKNGLPAYINYDFISGKKGAHLSVSGISGVATKTSYSSFILYSLMQQSQIPKKNVKAVIFNVKGEDLLFLDKKNRKLKTDSSLQEEYQKLGLKAEAFSNVGFYTSGKILQNKEMEPSTKSRKDLRVYSWSVEEIIKKDLFPYFFAEAEDSNIGFLIRQASNYLKKAFEKGDIPSDELQSLSDILRFFENEEIQDQVFRNAHSSSKEAFLRRLSKVAFQSKNLIHPNSKKENKIDFTEHQTTVVDIHNLSSTAQMFVVSSLIKEIYEIKEQSSNREPLVFIMLDELNKYAPRNSQSPIKETLTDIAERGRSLGILLIGAQQTASEIEKRVYANSAIKIVGRLDAGEAQSSEYQYLPSLTKKRALMLSQGEMIVSQPDIPYSLTLNFPFPSWATTSDEVLEEETSKKDNSEKVKAVEEIFNSLI